MCARACAGTSASGVVVVKGAEGASLPVWVEHRRNKPLEESAPPPHQLGHPPPPSSPPLLPPPRDARRNARCVCCHGVGEHNLQLVGVDPHNVQGLGGAVTWPAASRPRPRPAGPVPSSSLGVGREQGLHQFGPPPPHHRLVQGEVPCAVGMGCPGGLHPQQGVDSVPGHLEGARGVEGEVAPVVWPPGLLGESGHLGPGEKGAVPFADKIGGSSTGGMDVSCERKKMRFEICASSFVRTHSRPARTRNNK
jgi:hypothetical protein